MGPLGWQETVFIFVLALLFFGPKKLPELGKQLAKGLAEFRRASNELKATFDREMSNLERETEGLKETTQQVHNELTSGYDSYSESSYYDYETNYGHTPESSASNNSSSVSASATQGAESTTSAPDGTVPASSPNTVVHSPSTDVAAAVEHSSTAEGAEHVPQHDAPAQTHLGDRAIPA